MSDVMHGIKGYIL